MAISAKTKKSSRFFKLMGSLGRKRRKIERVNARAGAMGRVSGMRPSVFRKFMKYMQQVAVLRDKERRIICKIDTIEQKHSRMRKCHCLKAANNKKIREEIRQKTVRKAKKDYGNWWWLFVLFLLLSSDSRNKSRSLRQRLSPR